MHNTSKSLLFAFAMFLTPFLNAQTTPANQGMEARPETEASADKADADLAKELNLDKKQNEQFKKINKDYKAKAKAARKAKKEDHQKMHAERMAAHKALLTKEQAQKYDEIMAKRQEKRAAKKAERKADKKEAKGKSPKPKKGQE